MLLATMMIHEAAYNLKSKNNGAQIALDISRLFTDVLAGPFNLDYFHQLSIRVADRRPDEDTWRAVFNLIDMIATFQFLGHSGIWYWR